MQIICEALGDDINFLVPESMRLHAMAMQKNLFLSFIWVPESECVVKPGDCSKISDLLQSIILLKSSSGQVVLFPDF